MANNKTKKKGTNKLILFNPNPCDNEMIAHEDLSILVDLTTTRRGRSVISIDNIGDESAIVNNQEDKSDTIGFIDGTPIGEGKRALTTNYLEANTTFNVNGENDLESLGIESIDINFDTAYTPIIKIKFIDIRGHSIFQAGSESKYKMFFELPYPIFNLTVKGFFGKAVKYCLHLTKWNSSFNSQTGNFEIDAEFIGYTYALLTDLLMGYLRAVVCTEIGGRIFDEYREEWASGGKTLKTIDEMLKDIQRLGGEFEKIKQEDSSLKDLDNSTKVITIIDDVEAALVNLGKIILPEATDFFNDGHGIIVTTRAQSDVEVVKNSIKNFKTKIERDLNDTNLYKDVTDDNLKLNIKEINIINIIRGLKGSDFIIADDGVDAIFSTRANLEGVRYFNNTAAKAIPNREAKELAEIVNQNLPSNFATLNKDTQIAIYDMRRPLIELERVKKNINSNNKKIREKMGEKLAEKANTELGFDPTIQNIFTILTVHCEVFLKTLSEVSKQAESSATRTRTLTKLKADLDVKNKSTIFPWPEYKKNDNKRSEIGYQESWLGNDLPPGGGGVTEVIFVEELLQCLMDLVVEDDKLLEINEGAEGPQFYPVSPLDVAIFDESQIVKNPYEEALTGTRSKGTPDEATRLLLMRAFLGLGVGNKQLDPLNKQLMGTLEADNLFDVIKDFKEPLASNIINGINNQFEGSPAIKGKSLIEYWKKGETNANTPTGKSKGLFIDKTTNGVSSYVYNYISDNVRTYLPISGGFDGQDFFNSDGTLKSVLDTKLLASNILFTGNYVNNTINALPEGVSSIWDINGLLNSNGQPRYKDDGSQYLKIMSEHTYELKIVQPPFGGDVIEENFRQKVPVGTVINQSSLLVATYDYGFIETIDPYSGRYNALEIDLIKYDGVGGSSDKVNETRHFNMRNGGGTLSSVLCSYWNQEDDNDTRGSQCGTYLSRKEFINPNGTLRDLTYNLDFSDLSKPISGIGSSANDTRVPPSDYGKQRVLMGDLLGLSENPQPEEVNIPYIEFSISNYYSTPAYHFSLFGSQFYYEQDSIGRTILFLHTFGWNGCIGDISDLYADTDATDVSLFDTYGGNYASFKAEDDTYTIKGLFNTNGSFIKAPRLWCAFIGSLLYRLDENLKNPTKNQVLKFRDDLFPWQDKDSATPYFWEYLYDSRAQSPAGMNFVFQSNDKYRNDRRRTKEEYAEVVAALKAQESGYPWSILYNIGGAKEQATSRATYPIIDRGLLGLPQQIRDEFKNVFLTFSDEYTLRLAPELEIVKDYDRSKWESDWSTFAQSVDLSEVTDESQNFFNQTLKTQDVVDAFGDIDAVKNYNSITPVVIQPWFETTGDAYMYNLELHHKSNAVNALKEYIKETYVIANGVPDMFRVDENVIDNKVFNRHIEVTDEDLRNFTTDFYTRFTKLTDERVANETEADDEIQNRIFNSIDDDMIKLNIYRSLSSIHNKWVAGTDDPLINGCGAGQTRIDKEAADYNRGGGIPHFIDSFRFLDRSFSNIGDKFYLNPLDIFAKIIGNYNQSFFDIINDTLIQNNFNFIALPNFLNFNDEKQMEEMFTPYTYKEVAGGDYASGPSFVCVYAGQTSTNLDLGEDSDYPDDGIVIQSDCAGNYEGGAPEDFTAERNKDGSTNIPLFLVKYGQQNQTFFKDIKLDQREFVETAESLEIIENLSQSADNRKPNFNGQNLFNVYQTRSYSAEVEMMGNAMVQPMMYFQLDNIPMFRGAYMIIKVTHQITAHNMSTKFKGVRIKRTKTPLIEKSTLFMNLLGSLEGLGSIGGGTVGAGPGSGVRKTNAKINEVAKWIDTPMNVNLLPITGQGATSEKIAPDSGYAMQENSALKYGFREVIELLQTVFKEFHEQAKFKDYNDEVYVGDISLLNGGITSRHSTHQIGRDIDFRQIVIKKPTSATFSDKFFRNIDFACKENEVGCTKTNGIVNQKKTNGNTIKTWDPEGDSRATIGNYSRAGTRDLINIFKKYSGKLVPGVIDGNYRQVFFPKIENIWFNDPVLIAEFPGDGEGGDFGGVAAMENHTHHLHIKFQIPDRVTRENQNNTNPDGQNTRIFGS